MLQKYKIPFDQSSTRLCNPNHNDNTMLSLSLLVKWNW